MINPMMDGSNQGQSIIGAKGGHGPSKNFDFSF